MHPLRRPLFFRKCALKIYMSRKTEKIYLWAWNYIILSTSAFKLHLNRNWIIFYVFWLITWLHIITNTLPNLLYVYSTWNGKVSPGRWSEKCNIWIEEIDIKGFRWKKKYWYRNHAELCNITFLLLHSSNKTLTTFPLSFVNKWVEMKTTVHSKGKMIIQYCCMKRLLNRVEKVQICHLKS